MCKVTDDVERAKIPRRAAREVKLEESASHHEVGVFSFAAAAAKMQLERILTLPDSFFLDAKHFSEKSKF